MKDKFAMYRADNFETLIDKYKKLDLERIFPFIDRTGAIPNYLKTTIYTPMPELDRNFNLTFEEICEKRLKELMATGKKINLLWSGGLDSTNLLALIYRLPNNEKKQFTVHLNYNSIVESGYMYDTFVKNVFNNTINSIVAYGEYKEDEIYITGDPGNHIHTIPSIESYKNFIPGKDLFDPENVHLLKRPYKDYVSDEKQEFYYPALQRSPREVITLEDFIWFNTFNFRWDESRFALFLKLLQTWKNKSIKPSMAVKNIIGFYYTDEFQQWSIHRKEPQYELNNFKKTIKLEMRNIMRKSFGPEGDNYVNNKGIVQSPIAVYIGNYMFLTKEMMGVYDEG